MVPGIPLLREQLSRVLGVDTFSPEGDRQVALALLDLYSHTLMTPQLAATARVTFDGRTAPVWVRPAPTEEGAQT